MASGRPVRKLLYLLMCFALVPRAVRASEDCDLEEGKGGLCGYAASVAARMDALTRLDSGFLAASSEAQADFDVLHCFLDFEIRFDTSPKRIQGSNTLGIRSLTGALTQLTLDLQSNMTVTGVTVDGAAATFTRPGNQVVINLGWSYNAGQEFQVRVSYQGTPLNRTDFFGSTQYFFGTHAGTSIASSLSQPFQANYWWPCKENYSDVSDKFTMDMHVTVPDTMVVAANGALQGVDTLQGGKKKYRWRESYPIATYLVAFGATNYTKLTYNYVHPGGTMPVEFYHYPEQVPSTARLNTIMEALAVFSAPGTYGEYPFINEKYGIMQFPWCCGMEHQTITSQGDYTSERRNIHELSHMWWGDNVTCRTWNHAWLNEGFARFSEAVFYERRTGGSYSAYISHLNAYRPGTSGTGTVYRYDIGSSSAIFDTTYTYNKGAWVTHMLRGVLGDQVFFDALAAYRQMYQGGAADTEEFQSVCEAVSGRDLDWFFSHWIYKAGAPYYRYGWEQQQINGQNWLRLHVEQYQKTVNALFPGAIKMPIDITLNTTSGSRTHVIWNDAAGTDSTVRQWFVLPADGTVTSLQFDKDTKILRGAATQVAYVPLPPKILTMSPAPGSVNSARTPITAIRIGFSEAVSFAGSHFRLSGSRSGQVPVTVTYSPADYVVTLTCPPLGAGEWWTVFVLDGVTSIASGAALDGELADPASPSSLPSGDGLPGGTAMLLFKVTIPADFNADDRVDTADLEHFLACGTGANIQQADPACQDADIDGDTDVDQADFGLFQRCIAGSASRPDPTCAN